MIRNFILLIFIPTFTFGFWYPDTEYAKSCPQPGIAIPMELIVNGCTSKENCRIIEGKDAVLNINLEYKLRQDVGKLKISAHHYSNGKETEILHDGCDGKGPVKIAWCPSKYGTYKLPFQLRVKNVKKGENLTVYLRIRDKNKNDKLLVCSKIEFDKAL
uniref:ML domain salivary peptide n=1 Tax=Nyssomyia intermedia TaxID=182990 RepID=J7HF06_9DIPT